MEHALLIYNEHVYRQDVILIKTVVWSINDIVTTDNVANYMHDYTIVCIIPFYQICIYSFDSVRKLKTVSPGIDHILLKRAQYLEVGQL